MEKYFQSVVDWWKNLGKEKQRMILIIGSIILILTIILTVFLTRKNYTFLIGGLDQVSSGNIIRSLEEMGITYKVDNFGNIYVANQNVAELRMRMAAEGILGTNIQGYEILQNQSFGATSYDKQVNYQIALEGELARSISSMSGINSARVHLVIPPRTYYQVGSNPEPSASVLLMVNPGVTIAQDQVRAIINLVSGAVQGLKPENVKVVDNFSKDLSAQVMLSENINDANTKFQLKTEVEKYYSNKVESSLQSVFGLGNVVVVSEVDLNWEKIEQQERRVEPVVDENGIILSQQSKIEQSGGQSTGGIPGVDSNIPPYTYQTQTGTDNYYSSSDIITNYDVNEIYRKTIEDKNGEISNKSFTVFIDFLQSKMQNTEELRSQITKAIATAVGTSETNISLVDIQFNRDIETLRSQIESELQQRRQRIVNIVIAIIIILMIIIFLIIVSKTAKSRKAARLIEERKKQLETEAEAVINQKKVEVKEYSPDEEKIKELEDLANKNPDEVAEIIKIWLRSQ